MLPPRQLDLLDALFDLEPDATYPERAAAALAELTGASGYRLSHGSVQVSSKASASGGAGLAIPLAHGKRPIGSLHLYGPDGAARLADEQVRFARWGAKVLARGLALAPRLAAKGSPAPRGEVDVQAMLAGTPLTPRERDVVGRLVAGASTREISEATKLTVSTVNTYMKRIFAKLGVHSRVELLARVNGTHAASR